MTSPPPKRKRQVRLWDETSTGRVIKGVGYFAIPLSLPNSLPVGTHQIEVIVGKETLTGMIEILPPEPRPEEARDEETE